MRSADPPEENPMLYHSCCTIIYLSSVLGEARPLLSRAMVEYLVECQLLCVRWLRSEEIPSCSACDFWGSFKQVRAQRRPACKPESL